MTRGGLFLALATLACGVAAAPASAAPAKKAAPARPVARDWTRTVVVTPEGGHRMGNANARVKLIEYGSLTCGHCAQFAAASHRPLLAQVRAGKVSYEFRNYVLNGIDVVATLLARCAGPNNFFPLTDRLFATQTRWMGKVSGLPQAEKDRLKALPEGARLVRVAQIGGLTALAAQAGVTPQRGNACLADSAAVERLGQISEAAQALGVAGTPTFFINGQNVGTHDWPQIEQIITQAGG